MKTWDLTVIELKRKAEYSCNFIEASLEKRTKNKKKKHIKGKRIETIFFFTCNLKEIRISP